MEFSAIDQEIVQKALLYAINSKGFDEATKQQLINACMVGSPGDKVCNVGELLYAHYDKLDNEAKAIMANCFAYATRMGWTSFNKDNRCNIIVGMVLRDLGEQSFLPLPEHGTEPEPITTLREDRVDWRNPTEQAATKEEPSSK